MQKSSVFRIGKLPVASVGFLRVLSGAMQWGFLHSLSAIRVQAAVNLTEPPGILSRRALGHAIATEHNRIGARIPNLPLARLVPLSCFVAIAVHALTMCSRRQVVKW